MILGLKGQGLGAAYKGKEEEDEFEMSMMDELNFFLGLQTKQMKDAIFFNQSKYIKEMLKNFGLEDSKPMKTPMSLDTKLMKDEECESVDSTMYRGMIGTYKSKITRKQSKTGKNRCENQKSTKPKPEKPSLRVSQIKGCVGQFKEAQVQWQGQMGQIKSLTSSHSRGATSTMVKAQRGMGFCAKILTKEAQVSLKWIATLAIRVRSLIDLTARIFDPMIDEMIGLD
ncbi:retrovirus-related pol polyprotein from transposon TNT 1-94 [Tanacetum coccineum]|uniref:Retrovirus-related pol polyprotein from transposon TNT 1-94 n=1 Tax=Tanacetum coccineum TaxID=301880 RepID=A0ABQ5H1I7_9ASTR